MSAIPTILSQIRSIDRKGLSSATLHVDLESLAVDLNAFLGENTDEHTNALSLGFAYEQRKSGFRYLWKVVYSEIMFPHSADVYGMPCLLIKRLTTVTTSKVHHRVRLDELTVIFENLDYGDFRVMVMRGDVIIELRFESLVCCRRFISGCETAMNFRKSKINFTPNGAPKETPKEVPNGSPPRRTRTSPLPSAVPKNPATKTADEDLLGLFDSNSDDDPDVDVSKPFVYHSPKKAETSTSDPDTDITSKPLKEIIRLAKSLNINTDGMLDREELEEAVKSVMKKGLPKQSTSTSRTSQKKPTLTKPNLAQQMNDIKLQREEEERMRKQRAWQEQEDDRRMESERMRRASAEQYQKERQAKVAWEEHQRKLRQDAYEEKKKEAFQRPFPKSPKPSPQPFPAPPRDTPRPQPNQPPSSSTPAPEPIPPDALVGILNGYVRNSFALKSPNVLHSISHLLLHLQNVFPPITIGKNNKPVLQISRHPYFDRYPPILPSALTTPQKIARSLKRVRFFLHPDKLPPNFDDGQRIICRCIWDVLSEAHCNYEENRENMGWATG